MNEIRPGILVEIVDGKPFILGRKYIGCISVVVREDIPGSGYWILDGPYKNPEGKVIAFASRVLRPINDGTIDKLIEKWQRESRQGVPA